VVYSPHAGLSLKSPFSDSDQQSGGTVKSAILLLLPLLLSSGCSERVPESLPAELLQVWRTSAPGYRDRHFELRDGWLLFGTGRFSSSMHEIEKVTSDPMDRGTRYTIAYRADDGSSYTLEIFYLPGNPARLRVGQQHDSWVPEKHALWLKEAASG